MASEHFNEIITRLGIKVENPNDLSPNTDLRKLTMIKINHCDYTGNLFGEPAYCVTIPFDRMWGVMCRKELIDYAEGCVYEKCKEKKIYPIGEKTQSELGLGEVFSIKRSSGKIESGWSFDINKSTCTRDVTPDDNSDIYINVLNHTLNVEKSITLKELCEINKIDYKVALSVLDKNLYDWYHTKN